MEGKRKQIYFVSDIIYYGDEIHKICRTYLNASDGNLYILCSYSDDQDSIEIHFLVNFILD